MDFKTSQKLYSVPRMRKYQNACAGDKRKTMQLYRYNLRLCQRFYGALNLFEVMLRNAINEHYAAHYSDPDWIVNQADTGKQPDNVIQWAEKPDEILNKIDGMVV